MDITAYISLLGLFQGILLSFFVLRNKAFRSPHNRYFAFFLIVLTIIGLDSQLSPMYHRLNDFWFTVLDIVGDDIPWIMMCYLPLFSFFVKTTGIKMRLPVAWLYLPFGVFLCLNILIDLDLDFSLLSIPALTENRFVVYELEDYISLALFIPLHIYLYVAGIGRSENKWIKNVWWFCNAIILLWLLALQNHLFFEDFIVEMVLSGLWLLVTAFIYWLIYTGLFQFNLAQNRQLLQHKLSLDHQENRSQKEAPGPTAVPASAPEKKASSKSRPGKANDHFEKLKALLEEEGISRDPELSRDKVAEQLSISSSYLTQIIRANSGMSFPAFINQYRVQDVERMLADPSFDNFDVLSIGLEAGFKSKSAFYSTFRKTTGMTPTQFRKRKS